MSDWQNNPPHGNSYGYSGNPHPGNAPLPPNRPPRGTTDPDDLSLPLYGATFKQAMRRFFKSYTRFSGRASLSEYWWVQLGLGLIAIIPATLIALAVIFTIAISAMNESNDGSFEAVSIGAAALPLIALLVFIVFYLATLIPLLAIEARRLHDAGFTGYLILLRLVPGGSLVLLVMSFLPSTSAGERFDPGMNQGW